MSLETIFVDTLIPSLGNYIFLIILLITILSGNIFILLLGILSGQGILPYLEILFIAIIGTLIADIIWFNIGKTKYLDKILRKKHFLYNYRYIRNFLDRHDERNLFIVFFTSKFSIGSRLITLMYSGRREMHWDRFVKYDFQSTALWVFIVISFGWLVGKGFIKVMEIFNSFKTTFISFIFFIIIMFIIWKIITDNIVKRLIYKSKLIMLKTPTTKEELVEKSRTILDKTKKIFES